MTDMIFYLAQSKVNQLDKCIQDKLDQALHLANKVSKNPDLAIRFQLEIEAGYRNQLTLSDLNRLFMLADMNEYRRATGLDDAQIKALHQAMAQYVNFSILKTHYEKIKKYAEEVRQDPTDQTKVYNLGYELFAENIVPTDDAAMQFFQKEEGLLIRPEQYDSIHMLLAKDEKTNNFNNVLIQARIGGGKSKVIGPLAALKKANGSNLVIQQVKSSLLELSYASDSEKTQRLFNRKLYLLKFERHPMWFKPDEKTGQVFSDALEDVFDSLSQCVATKNYMMTSGPVLQAIQLQFFDTLRHREHVKDPNEILEWQKQVYWLCQILLLFKTKGSRIIDECHDELDPLKKTNFIVGDSEEAPEKIISWCTDLFFFLKQVNVGPILGLQNPTSAYELVLDNTLMSDPDNQMDSIMRAIATRLVYAEEPNNLLSPILNKLNLSDEQKRQLVNYLLNQQEDICEILLGLEADEKEILGFLKVELSNILPFTLREEYNKTFGSVIEEGRSRSAQPLQAEDSKKQKEYEKYLARPFR